MANSKSNIYPIQLQGAELNLNKLDAEIKQYSGFNKNNSPFVGGCLSNVFHKEEQISGGNADNTYIDTNGDVYQVTTEGLFKNGEKLIDYTGKKFYSVEKLDFQFPFNTVFVDNEKVYITKTSNTSSILKFDYFLNVYNDFSEEWQSVKLPITKTYQEGPYVMFDIKCCRNDDTMLIACVYETIEKCGLFVYKVTANGLTLTSDVIVNSEQVIRGQYPVTVHLEQNGDTGIITVLTMKANSEVPETLIKNYSFSMSGEINLTGSSVKSGFVVSNTRLYYIQDGSSTYSDNKRPYVIKYRIVNGAIVEDEVINIETGNLTRPASFFRLGFYRNYGFINNFKYNNSGSHYLIGVCDFWTQIAKDLNFAGGAIVGDYVLVNNKVPTGLCLPGGNILVTEWNALDPQHIYVQKYKENYNGVINYDNADVIFKTNSGWFKLVESTPKLKKILNQVICNVNDIKNSFDIKLNRFILFAPAWNNRLISLRREDYDYKLNTKYRIFGEDIAYMASSINEYDLGLNASILINPVPISKYESETDRNSVGGPSLDKISDEDTVFVNYYLKFLSTDTVYYLYSVSLKEYINCTQYDIYNIGELRGLPFPSDTNGNVQYCPSLFAEFVSAFGNDIFVREGTDTYQLMKSDNQPIMSYYLGTLIEGLQEVFILQGQYYGIINNQIFAIQFNNGVVANQTSTVSVKNLQFVGNTPYEALFFSKTNRCLYSFTGANVLNQKQLVDKISEVRNYLYNPATQTVFLITDIGVLFYGLFGMFLLEYTNISNIFLLDNGIVMSDNSGNYRYIKYYLDEGDEGYTKENIRLETCFYGMNNEVVTINDCLYFRLFSEEHEEGDLKVSATTISLSGRKTEETTFKIKASDWDKITHTIYLRYQPKTQRGLGVSFSIDSPFKIASMSVGSQPDAVLVDKVSKGAITAPSVTTNNNEW